MGVNGKVLVVDDQEGIRKLLEETCMLLGYDVISAPSGTEAVKIAAEQKITAAVVDMKMPGLNGIETLKRLSAIDPDIKVVLMTGYGEMHLLEDALKLGACDIIRKPFDLEEIRNFLERVFLAG